jgi:hypothetical protein
MTQPTSPVSPPSAVTLFGTSEATIENTFFGLSPEADAGRIIDFFVRVNFQQQNCSRQRADPRGPFFVSNKCRLLCRKQKRRKSASFLLSLHSNGYPEIQYLGEIDGPS